MEASPGHVDEAEVHRGRARPQETQEATSRAQDQTSRTTSHAVWSCNTPQGTTAVPQDDPKQATTASVVATATATYPRRVAGATARSLNLPDQLHLTERKGTEIKLGRQRLRSAT